MNNEYINYIKTESYKDFSEFILIDVSHDIVVFYENNGTDIVETSTLNFFDFVSKQTAKLHQDNVSEYFDNLSVNKLQQNGGKISFVYKIKNSENSYENYLGFAKIVSNNNENLIIVSTIKLNYNLENKSNNQSELSQKLESISDSVSDVILKIYNTLDATNQKTSTDDYIYTLLDNLIRQYPEFNKQFQKDITMQVNKVKSSILIVDDDAMTRNLLKKCFSDNYDIVQASNGKEAIDFIEQNSTVNIVGIFLDLLMPQVDGFEVLEYLKKNQILSNIPVVIISGAEEKETRQRVYRYNIADMLEKPFNLEVIKYRTNNLINLYKTNSSINNLLMSQYSDLKLIIKEIINSYKHDNSTKIEKVKNIAKVFLDQIKNNYTQYNIDDYKIQKIIDSIDLYDVGLYVIPRTLGISGSFSESDKEKIYSYPKLGKVLVQNYLDKSIDMDIYNYSSEITEYSHELYNGAGFPYKMNGDEIPISAQVVSISSTLQLIMSKQNISNVDINTFLANYIDITSFNPILIDILKNNFDTIKNL